MILHDNVNRSQYEIARSASIHDTPPPQNLPEPDALLSAYLQVPDDLKITETKPQIEKRIYICSPSVTKVPFKKSRRTNRRKKHNSIRYKKTLKNQKLTTRHHYLTHEWWDEVNPFPITDAEDVFRKTLWTTSHNAYPLSVIAEGTNMSKASVRVMDSHLESQGFMKIKKQTAEYHYADGRVIKTKKKIHNYRTLTSKGRELREAIRKKAQHGIPIPKELDIGIVIITNSRWQRVPKLKKQLTANERQNLKESVKEKLGTPSSFNKLKHLCQAKRVNSNGEKIEDPEDYHSFLNARLDQILAREEQLKPELMTIFKLSGFEPEIPTMPTWLRKEVNKRPIKELIANLKWHEKKKKKKWRCRSFLASFVSVMQDGIPIGWMRKRAEEYQAAIRGDTRVDGIDSQAVVEMIIELQKKTGMIASKHDLHGLLCYGAIHLKSFLKVVLFKSNRTPISNWVGYVHFLAKKSPIELSNMYKSEEQIQAKHEAEDDLLRGDRNQRHASDWDKLLGDLEEGDE